MNAMKNELDEQELDEELLLDEDEHDDEEHEDDEHEDDELDEEHEDEELEEQVVVAGTPVMLAAVTLTAGRFLNAVTSPVNRSLTPDDVSVGVLPTSARVLTGNAVTPVLDAGLNT